MTVKIAVFAPMPSASVSTATSVIPRALLMTRSAYRRSCITDGLLSLRPERIGWIDTNRAARRNDRREQCRRQHACPRNRERGHVEYADIVEEGAYRPASRDRGDGSCERAQDDRPRDTRQHQTRDVARRGPEGHANAD